MIGRRTLMRRVTVTASAGKPGSLDLSPHDMIVPSLLRRGRLGPTPRIVARPAGCWRPRRHTDRGCTFRYAPVDGGLHRVDKMLGILFPIR
jgi:hypothetical protein